VVDALVIQLYRHGRKGFHQRDVHILAQTGSFTVVQRGIDCAESGGCGAVVADFTKDLYRTGVVVAVVVHHARCALRNYVIAGSVRIRAFVTPCGDGAVDQPGVNLPQGFIAQPQSVHCAGPVAFQYDVGGFAQLFGDFQTFRVFQVKNQRFFAVV